MPTFRRSFGDQCLSWRKLLDLKYFVLWIPFQPLFPLFSIKLQAESLAQFLLLVFLFQLNPHVDMSDLAQHICEIRTLRPFQMWETWASFWSPGVHSTSLGWSFRSDISREPSSVVKGCLFVSQLPGSSDPK